MRKQTDLVVHKLDAHSMVILDGIERHICCGIHGTRIMLKSRHVERIDHIHIQFGLFSHGTRVERRFHIKVMAKRRIVLSVTSGYTQYHPYNCYFYSFKHKLITRKTPYYCRKRPYIIHQRLRMKKAAPRSSPIIDLVFVVIPEEY